LRERFAAEVDQRQMFCVDVMVTVVVDPADDASTWLPLVPNVIVLGMPASFRV